MPSVPASDPLPPLALPRLLLHALWDRVRSGAVSDGSAGPSFALPVRASADGSVPPDSTGLRALPFDTGVGDGPAAWHALSQQLSAHGGLLAATAAVQQAAGGSGAVAAAAASGAAPGAAGGSSGTVAAHLLRSALKAVLSAFRASPPEPPATAAATAASCVPVALVLCSHPAVCGPPDDAMLRSRVATGLGRVQAASADDATSSSSPAHPAAANAPDAHGRTKARLWRAAYRTLCQAAGLDASLTAFDPASGAAAAVELTGDASPGAAAAAVVDYGGGAKEPARIDVLLQVRWGGEGSGKLRASTSSCMRACADACPPARPSTSPSSVPPPSPSARGRLGVAFRPAPGGRGRRRRARVGAQPRPPRGRRLRAGPPRLQHAPHCAPQPWGDALHRGVGRRRAGLGTHCGAPGPARPRARPS